jgi:hypothetical protein
MNSRQCKSADVSAKSEPSPRRKILSLPKSNASKAGLRPLTPETKRRRGRADRLALQRAENDERFPVPGKPAPGGAQQGEY